MKLWIKTYSGDKITRSYVCSGKGTGRDVFDAMMIMQNVVGSLTLNEYQTAAAKVSGGETVTVFDAMMIMQYVVGTVTSFPAEQ